MAKSIWIAAVTTMVAAAAPVHAVPVLDRSTWGESAFEYALLLGQGVTGNKQFALVVFDVINTGRLTSIDLALSKGNAGNASLTIHRGNIFNPNIPAGNYGPGLYAAEAPITALPNWYDQTRPTSFDLSAGNISVTAGETLSFIVTGAEPFHFNPGINNTFAIHMAGRDVAGASSYSSANDGIGFNGPNDQYGGDYMFRAFVDNGIAAAAVPEPATWGLMLAGFGMIGAGLRSRRRSTTVTYA